MEYLALDLPAACGRRPWPGSADSFYDRQWEDASVPGSAGFGWWPTRRCVFGTSGATPLAGRMRGWSGRGSSTYCAASRSPQREVWINPPADGPEPVCYNYRATLISYRKCLKPIDMFRWPEKISQTRRRSGASRGELCQAGTVAAGRFVEVIDQLRTALINNHLQRDDYGKSSAIGTDNGEHPWLPRPVADRTRSFGGVWDGPDGRGDRGTAWHRCL